MDIQRRGRFAEPILKRMLDDETDPAMRARIKQTIASTARTD
jgi:hypothetical protein